jgi:hypothetical protein
MNAHFEQEGLRRFFPEQDKQELSSLAQLIRKQKKIIEKLDDVNYLFKPEFGSLVNFSQSRTTPVHRWFKYREGYSPDLIYAFFDANEKMVLDPFCGSGTTLVCAKQRGIDCVGVDVNPLSTFVSRVKTYPFLRKDLIELRELSESILDVSVAPDDPPKLRIINKVFPDDILDYLLRLKVKINSIAEGKLRDTLFLGFLAILEIVSNTKKEGNGIKYRSTRRTKNGYVHLPDSVWQHQYYGKDKLDFVKKKLQAQFRTMLLDIESYCINLPQTVTKVSTNDSTQLHRILNEGKLSLVIFSPPYANCFDYFEIFKVELWMGDFVKSYADIRELRRKSIGTLWQQAPSQKMDLEELNEIISLFEGRKLWDKKIISMLAAYFSNMEKVLKQIYDVLMPHRKCVIVVGNSAYSNILIPTDLLLAKIGREVGFKKLKLVFARHLTTSSQQKKKLEQLRNYLRESIIVLEK